MSNTPRYTDRDSEKRIEIMQGIRESLGEATQEDLEALVQEALVTINDYYSAVSSLAHVPPADKNKLITEVSSLANQIIDQKEAIFRLSAILDYGVPTEEYGIGQ